MECLIAVVGKVGGFLSPQVGHQISYLIHYKDNVAELKQKTEDLKGMRERVQGRIDEAVRKGEVIEPDVQTWITSVHNITSDAETFLASEDDAAKKIACFHLSSRYGSSKAATEKTSSVLKLQEKGDRYATVLPVARADRYATVLPVARAAPPPGIYAHSSKNIDAYKSQKSAMEDVMDALKEEKIHIVGVCGLRGVGKTTLVAELGKRVKESKQFDEVVMVVVSQRIKITKIQDDIACALRMDKLPDGQARREKLWYRLSNGNKVLLILDDLWSGLELDEIGVPVDQPDCKIVLTSRSKEVCNNMDAHIVSVEPMPEEEAWSLFKSVVGEAVETDGELNPIAKAVTRECSGLPIAILAVGRALRNKTKREWEDAHDQLQKVAPPSVDPITFLFYGLSKKI